MTQEEMREPTFLVLTALAAGRRHGYGVIEDVAALSGGRVTLRPGSLYATLDRLTTEGAVRVDGEETVNGRMRRYFVLTDEGAQRLAERAEQLSAASIAARKRLSTRPRQAQA